jgi:hypothetical protein
LSDRKLKPLPPDPFCHQDSAIAHANGGDIYIYPGFVMMPSTGKDFVLIDVRELQANFSEVRFIEEEDVPGDSEEIGRAWKRANKDGPPDRRFVDNYEIPIMRYAKIEFRSSSGLYEVYQFSNFAIAFAFHQSLAEYQNAIVDLAKRSKDRSAVPLLAPLQDNSEEVEVGPAVPSEAPALAQPLPLRFLVFDWVVLAIVVASLGGAGMYFTHGAEIKATFRSLFPSQIQTSPVAPSMPPVATGVPPVAPAVPPVAPAVPPKASTPTQRVTVAQPRREVVYVLKPNVNVRTEPSTTSPVLSVAQAGRKLNVFQRQGEWAQVGEDGPMGWVHQSLLGGAPP